MKSLALGVLLVLELVARASCQDVLPDPETIIMNVIKAYARYQTSSATEIDTTGETDWYRRYFINWPALKKDYSMPPPELIPSTQSAKPVRVSTLMCPYKNFTYDCELSTATIHGSASATTVSQQFSNGWSYRQSWSADVSFLGVGGKEGITESYSYMSGDKSDNIDVTTQQVTTTGSAKITVSPSAEKCFELKTSMDQHTQSGISKLQAVFYGAVGFHNDESTTWTDDPTSHYYRLRDITGIVSTALNANLPEARGWETSIDDAGRWVATYSNTYKVDYFLGTDGRNANFGYDKGSTECIKNLPPGWADWMHLPDSSFATGRRLLSPPGTKSAETSKSPRMIVKLLRSTGQLSPEEGANYTDIHFDSFASLSGPEAFPGNKVPSRKLLQVKGASSAATKGVPCTTWAHVDNGVTREVKSPFCSETGLKLYQSSRAKTKHAKRKIAHQCAVSVDVPASSYNNLTLLTQAPDGAPGSLKLKVQAEGGDCRFAATASEELDARDAAKKAKLAAAGGETPAASTLGEAGDFITKLKKLTSTLCFYESGSDCEVDTDGSTDWYKQYFKDYASITQVVGSDDVRMTTPTTFEEVASNDIFCQYNPDVKMICSAGTQEMNSQAQTKSLTTSINVSGKMGFKIKAAATFLGIGAESETEMSLDWAYSFASGESKTQTDGASTTANIQVPMTPDMNKCAKINLVTRVASANGATRAWVSADGWVGTHQQPSRHWIDQDSDSEAHYFRTMHIAYIIRLAQDKGLGAGDAFDWYIDNQGRGCLYNAVDFTFQQGLTSYANPRLYDKDSDDCKPPPQPSTGLAPDTLPATADKDGWVIVEGIPLEGTGCKGLSECNN